MAELCTTPLISDANLRSYWRLSDLTDDKGATGSLTNVNSVTLGATYGRYGSGGSFDGASAYLYSGENVASGNKTLSFWARPSAVMSSGTAIMVGNIPPTGARFYIGYQDGKVWIGQGTNSNNTYNNLAATAVDWYYFALVSSGTVCTAYQNGTALGSVTFDQSNAGSISIGYSGGGTPGYFFAGYIDDVALFTRALSLEDILTIYKDGRYLSTNSKIW